MKIPGLVYSLAFLLSLAGCVSLAPLKGPVEAASIDYGTVMTQFDQQQIISNILRAKDGAPLHFSELGQITGSLQAQTQIGASVPFGKYAALSATADTFAPQLTFTTGPTFVTNPLDTQAFTVGLMQPIDASYFVSLWENPVSRHPNRIRQLLLFLFISSISNPASGPPTSDSASDQCNNKKEIENTIPENPCFAAYVHHLVKTVNFKRVTVLTPIGPPFYIGSASGSQGKSTGIAKGKVRSKTNSKGARRGNLSYYKWTDIMPLDNETSVHLQKHCENTNDCTYQFYRIWSHQFALCLNNGAAPGKILFNALTFSMRAAPTPQVAPTWNLESQVGATSLLGSERSVQTAVMPIVGIFNGPACFRPIVKNITVNSTEPEYEIHLRSIRDVIEYLGAIVGSGKPLTTESHKLIFQLSVAHQRKIHEVGSEYQGKEYYADGSETKAAISILSELVNSMKQSKDIATTKQVTIVP